ncbi:MAG: esterase-like activity of phytase family protein [Rhodobacteraceae bacterium]|nr:esterase-like activity of phytase family protein [Paracoccaceae bacterium]
MMRFFLTLLLGSLWLTPVLAQPVLRHESTLPLQMDDPRFGGFSSLEVSADGLSFISTSDRGSLLRGDIIREGEQMLGVENLALTPILDTKGRPLMNWSADAEGLAISDSGAIYMSFEGNHRVMRQSAPGALPEFAPKHPDFSGLINNSALEALAIDDAGVVYAIPERSGAYDRPFPVYRLLGAIWNRDWEIARTGDYLVTGADIFEGQLYVLERDLAGLFGFSSRIRRFDIGGEGLQNEQELLVTAAGRFDNLEGISVWRGPSGALRVMMISDDNFRFFQKNQLVEFVLEAPQ